MFSSLFIMSPDLDFQHLSPSLQMLCGLVYTVFGFCGWNVLYRVLCKCLKGLALMLTHRGPWLSFSDNNTVMHQCDLFGSGMNLKHNIKIKHPTGAFALFFCLHMIGDLLAGLCGYYHKVCQNIWTVPLTNGTRCTFYVKHWWFSLTVSFTLWGRVKLTFMSALIVDITQCKYTSKPGYLV